jgi:arylsulfatase
MHFLLRVIALAVAACVFGAAAAATSRPNIIFVMSDDQDGNRVRQDYADYLPTHAYLRDHGTTFVNHCADSPQCGPSRAATLSGRLPHNTGFLENGDSSGNSVASWLRLRNQTIGTFLTRAGYHAAFAGKWVNGDSCSSLPLAADGSPTWASWAQLCNTYVLYNSSYADPVAPGGLRVETGIHQSDSLASQAASQMHAAMAVGKPFYLHWAPVAPHESTCHGCEGRDRATCAALYPQDGGEVAGDGGENYGLFGRPCPAIRHRGLFLDLTMPRNPSWNRSSNAPVSFTAFSKHLSANESIEIDRTWIARLQALMSVDEMLGKIIAEVKSLGIEHSTYLFYTSDNGWHLGEHLLPPFNKREPYETDVQLPLYVMGPDVVAGRSLTHPTQHTDFAMTFIELAGAESHAPIAELDGMSMAPLLFAGPAGNATPWRQHSFQEFHENCNTWISLRAANESHTSSFRLWCTNQTEYFDLRKDPYELDNQAGVKGEHSEGEFSEMRRLLVGISTCKGESCRKPQPWAGLGHPPFPDCYLGLCTHAPKYGQCGHYVLKEPELCHANSTGVSMPNVS